MEALLGKRLDILHHIDNLQTLSAVEKGYSKKLRHLSRTQRVGVGLLHECTNNPELQMTVKHCPTEYQKADIFTKALKPGLWSPALEMLQIVEKKK